MPHILSFENDVIQKKKMAAENQAVVAMLFRASLVWFCYLNQFQPGACERPLPAVYRTGPSNHHRSLTSQGAYAPTTRMASLPFQSDDAVTSGLPLTQPTRVALNTIAMLW